MNIYTMADWVADRTFKAAAGQEIEEVIYYEMFNTMPIQGLAEPAHGCYIGFRTTEPYAHDESGKAVYMAFGKKDGKFYYLGLQ